jgi:hypothetical protein
MNRIICILIGHRWKRYDGIRLLLLHDGPEIVYADGLPAGTVYDCTRCGTSAVQ